ncbi:glyoxalase superfamily protein [Curvivirga aplysinae]|uniref:glyoxalase superfamily protein n=1 Tax=Curvivirga aplysinae TaxID=2529852 RepID=UPI0012BBBBDC|nr:glyoxalase superfamily protein [Curvivirga aplysinae]MTI10052.1 hypothetical protein [Curvivirga aplysinae]
MIDAHIEDIVPVFHVSDMVKSLDYYITNLKFKSGFVSDDYSFAIIKLSQTALHLVKIHKNQFTPVVTYIWYKETDQLAKKLNQGITETPYGMKEFRITDPDGNYLIYGENSE